jgi:sensor histidine kinase regulating citrate/malate metabolism
MYLFDMLHKTITFFVAGITIAILILWFLNLRSFYKFTVELNKEFVIQETDRLQLEESLKLTQTLSAQRHDFKNQLQVIRMLAQMDRSEDIIKFIQEYNTSLDQSSSIYLNINNPAISAMLMVFFTQAKTKNLKFIVDCDVDFTDFKISVVAITRVLGNIIRNAIEILEGYQSPERSIEITIWETADCYQFSIWNNGPPIPGDIKENIFTPGFSTKNSSGLGLAIVKQLVEEMRGQISVQSTTDSGTEFRVVIPKNAPLVFFPKQPDISQTAGL